MSYNTIEFTVDSGVALLTLNRPEKFNSFNTEMHQELREVLKEVRSNDAIRCLLITGKGRAFCAGQDLGDRSVAAGDELPDLGESVEKNYNPLIRAITALELPVICAVNGVAAGAGSSLALAADIVLAARSASFIQSFCKIGVIPDSGSTWALPRLVGMARAKGLALLGDKLPAEQAEAWGLIWQCVDDEELAETSLAMAKQIATQPTKGLSLIKRALKASTANSLDEQLELEKDYMRIAGRTEDYREGVAAFMEKRPAVFKGR
ncbi:2-(1,2-epoxy-1,2-dihydrophenyl)acetyl-CoA isomerase PaaG [Dasania sp. GY-MA-18]|uniref:2-(1,2-epoxy-1,2-dihydrophenyl)acetyl-CoA isomerase PaaG n=1 Tax=Dasania phycosphaerae TaxID=2950436 RepID=A0A9J6RSG7_9GAMM|nr:MULTISPECIES: 2-(1,2-epoxy-1,2-dihydrophenyl)acetyl-CoA isomerase PaaG [Dasania]MCR8924452.1 2-(1,2-epoxy-1,2-dihydrophenyl)acetyl-CoA isomerase PaaG [Dasania sp. GY-MA-18]MCZ0867127.1 2-(1,2-epoxy-1,2-dihydrophenyl)acetyl-CoA isomerase PaaG [Dasania phycosphaerae]MCZ0870579.1 2-(1,2-epoxy-1,2-dihydrophenyl)acetyl-CoA isomerase PaaG [Dasania phycosphaerae]